MDIQQACQILQLDKLVSLAEVKRQYYRMALANHPDKNGSTARFQEINEAYETIQREWQEEEEEEEEKVNNNSYAFFLQSFLGEWFQPDDKIYDILLSMMQKGCHNVTLQIFEKIDRETAIHLLPFIIRFKDILRIEEETMRQLQDILEKKCQEIEAMVVLRPSLQDLMENNVYKYEYKGERYFVPLWHSEMVFEDVDANDFVIKCVPNLPKNITIDENNNIHIYCEPISLSLSLLETKTIQVCIEQRQMYIQTDKLFLRREQMFVFKRMGIAKINERNIYNVENRSDIICHITLK